MKTPSQLMNRSRPDDIDPMVPELPPTTYATDGGDRVSTASDAPGETESEAPLVPDLS